VPAVTADTLNDLSEKIIGAAIKVHRKLGPGLLESSYRVCVAYELAKLHLRVECENPVPVVYEDVRLDAGYRIDMLVNDLVIVEFKCVEKILPIHEAQLLSYLRLSGCRLGLLLKFHTPRLVEGGIKRIVNDFPAL
jgi:GxxExxY protein